jgi:hypothetical protein
MCNCRLVYRGYFFLYQILWLFSSPHALPKTIPDRLVCGEVAYQTVSEGITKELKATQKRVWPTYPIQVGEYSLLYFGHPKVEALSLEYISLSSI